MRNRGILIIAYAFFLFSCPSIVLAQANFFSRLIDSNTHGTASIHACDLDEDGDMDVLAAVIEDNDIVWWSNNGGSEITWTKHVIDGNFSGARSVYAADIDGDGDLDVLGTAYDGNQVAWWSNNGGDPIIWTKYIITYVLYQPHEIYAVDIDGDDDIDVLTASSGSNKIDLWRNDGGDPIVWNEQLIGNNVAMAKSVRAADIDGDGAIDVIGAGLGDNRVIWWRNNGGDPIYWTENTIDNDFYGAHRVEAVDLDEDGDMDVVGAAYSGHEVAWWRNEGGNPPMWTKQTIDSNFVNACVASAADIDGDGDIDVAATAQGSDEIAWWSNDGGDPINWTKSVIDHFDRPWPLYICDLDGDGDQDILAGSSYQGTNEVKWYENLGEIYLSVDFSAEPICGNAPLEVQFVDLSAGDPPITSRAWDFDNDGIVDSDEQNPIWIYSEPGHYSVKLDIASDSLVRGVIRDDFIHVFDGCPALNFDGEYSFVVCQASPSLNITDEFTAEAWIKPYGWGENGTFGFGKVVDKISFKLFLFNTGSLNNHSLVLQLFNQNQSNSFTASPVNSINLDVWQHIAVTYDGIGEVKIYINGEDRQITQNGTPSGGLNDNNDYDLYIGNNETVNHTFEGIIDEVRLWNVVRSQSEIIANMNRYIHDNETGLVGYWRMDEGNGDIIYDQSDNNNDGAVVDADWVEGVDLNPTSIQSEDRADIPDKNFWLETYPNPCNAATTIRYNLAKTEFVKIDIFDILGRLVETVVNESQLPGQHSILWQANNRVSGVYFFRIQTENYAESDKIVLLK
jgi:PKD repeat protein